MSAFCITTDRSDRDLPEAVYEARTYGSVRRIKPKQITSALPYSICRQSQISTIEGSLNYSSVPIPKPVDWRGGWALRCHGALCCKTLPRRQCSQTRWLIMISLIVRPPPVRDTQPELSAGLPGGLRHLQTCGNLLPSCLRFCGRSRSLTVA
ncbi:hypothetical protein TherJR_0246 [Thermincola potens JR]|uniref:Uncharacterized protein n=1 Tax=Thermincola potens (strain JR) TaxID=635013 RepID=D5X9R2_THEPJ|nr:hypothetical protein TherJR_0246 [Thermincola potens JR]